MAEKALLGTGEGNKGSVCVSGCRGGRQHVTHVLRKEAVPSLYWRSKIFFFSVAQRPFLSSLAHSNSVTAG